jgi:hypothetical protein
VKDEVEGGVPADVADRDGEPSPVGTTATDLARR